MLTAIGPSVFAQETGQTPLPPGWIPPITPGYFQEPKLLTRAVNATDNYIGDEPKDGLYAEWDNMITGSGWISLGPGYRQYVLNRQAFIDVSAALSWKLYKVAQGTFALPHLAHDRVGLGAQVMYQDLMQVDYFGLGNDSCKCDHSAYRYRNTDILGLASLRLTNWLSLNGRFGWIVGPDLSDARGPRVSVPNTVDIFNEATAPGILTQPSFVHANIALIADSRDQQGHPTSGGLYRVGAAIYSDRDAGTYSFRRYDVEGSQFVPLFTKKWVLALHGWGVFSDTSNGEVVPFYLMPSLGGKNTMRGYYDYRFHDNDMESFGAESRWALYTHVDAAVFGDFGKVAPRASGLDLHDLKSSFGAGLRLHNSRSTLLRLDAGHSVEGWRVFVKVSDPFSRSTMATGRSSVVPFVP
jgi:outer membrane protein assembly factor BamA